MWRVRMPATGVGVLIVTCSAKFQCRSFMRLHAAEEWKSGSAEAARLQHTGNRLPELDLIDPGMWIQNITDDSQQPLIRDIL